MGGARGGFVGRRARRLVYFIEAHVAHQKEQLLWACRVLLGKARREWKAQDLFGGFATRDNRRADITARDLERHAPQWSRLVPASARVRAAVAHILGEKYGLDYGGIPIIRASLALDSPEVQQAYREEYGADIADDLRPRPAAGAAPRRPGGAGLWALLEDDAPAGLPQAPEDLPHESPPDSPQDPRPRGGRETPRDPLGGALQEAGEAASEEILAEDAEWMFVPGGDAVTRAGQPMDSLYVVASGRLREEEPGAIARPGAGYDGAIREYTSGDVLGENTILAGAPWKRTIRAVRDSELIRVSKEAVDRLLERHPRHGVELCRSLVARTALEPRVHPGRKAALTIALVPVDPGAPLSEFAAELTQALRAEGGTLRLDPRVVDDAVTSGASEARPGDDLDGMVAAWLSEQEAHHRFVVYQADPHMSAWTERCLRQADRTVLVARAGSDPSPGEFERRLAARSEVHLVLLHPPGAPWPRATAAWLAPRNLRAHHHVHLGNAGDARRVARLLAGDAIGLAMGGGGARGFVHAGVLRAFEELSVVPDVIGGTSMGAVAAALAAIGWDAHRIVGLGARLTRRGALFDYTPPVMALTASRKVTALVKSLFGDVNIEDLWQPYFCVSTNLTKGGVVVHRRGPLWEAVRASLALPGIFSPVLLEGNVLVDGGVLNNLPLDVMRELCGGGTVIGVRVTPPSGGFGSFDYEPGISGWQILWRRLNPFARSPAVPSIIGLLLRSIEVKDLTAAHRERTESEADILIHPDTSSVKMMDFSAYRELADAGYRAAREALARHPLAADLSR